MSENQPDNRHSRKSQQQRYKFLPRSYGNGHVDGPIDHATSQGEENSGLKRNAAAAKREQRLLKNVGLLD